MAGNKEKILATALRLFNEKGVPNVSQRTISNKLDISPGNLTYHFKRREDIETELYLHLVDTIDESLRKLKDREITVALLFEFIEKMLAAFFEYRFIFLDFVHIMRNNAKIAAYHVELTKKRKAQFMSIIDRLLKAGIFRPSEFENEYLMLYDRMTILSDFWVVEAEITKNGVQKTDLPQYKKIILHSIYPYLNDGSKKQFQLAIK